MTGIFIRYRRGDSSGWAGRLASDLVNAFGEDKVFFDIHSLAPGLEYDEAIEHWLGVSDVALAVIGPEWLTAADSKGQRRLDNPSDLTRKEVARALERRIPVVPVLVGGADMPAAEELPDDLKGLARRQACELSDSRWRYDQEQLIKAIRRHLPSAPPPEPVGTWPPSGPRTWRQILLGPLSLIPMRQWRPVLIAGAVAGVIGGVFSVYTGSREPAPPPPPDIPLAPEAGLRNTRAVANVEDTTLVTLAGTETTRNVLRLALGQVGTRADGSDDEKKRVLSYWEATGQRVTTANLSLPWSGAFLAWVLKEAGADAPERSTSNEAWLAWAREPSGTVQWPGTVGIYRLNAPEERSRLLAGIVLRRTADGCTDVIAGNIANRVVITCVTAPLVAARHPEPAGPSAK